MGDKDEEIGLGKREQASDKDKDKEEREEEGCSSSDFLSSEGSATEMKQCMTFAPSDLQQWDFRVSRIGGWIMRYLKGDTVTQRLAMDTMAQDLQKREEPPRIEEGESPLHKKCIHSPLKMCTLDKYGFTYHPDPKIDNFVDRKKKREMEIIGKVKKGL